MKAIQIPVLAAMAVILSASEARARTAATRNPVFGVESAKLEVTIGGALGLETGSALHLFAGSIPRADRFETELKEAVAEIFRASQIPFSKDAQHTLMLSFFGREIGETCPGQAVVFIDASFHDETLLKDPDYAGGSIQTWGQTLLEVAPDATLEESLTRAVEGLLKSLLDRPRTEEYR